jgi:hypothetical protein
MTRFHSSLYMANKINEYSFQMDAEQLAYIYSRCSCAYAS